MSVVACPWCRRALQLPDELRSESVRCPSCGTAFDAQIAQPPEAKPPLESPLPDRVPSAEINLDAIDPGVQLLRKPIILLTAEVICDLAGSLGWFVFLVQKAGFGASPVDVLICGGLMAYLPLVVVIVGIANMHRRQGQLFINVAAVFAVGMSMRAMVQLGWVWYPVLTRGDFGGAGAAVMLWLWTLVAAPAMICGYCGGVLTLMVLRRPEVRRVFRRVKG